MQGRHDILGTIAWIVLWAVILGCNRSADSTADSAASSPETSSQAAVESSAEIPPEETHRSGDASKSTPPPESTRLARLPAFDQFDASTLLGESLVEDELQEGWIRLFDGQTGMGWNVVGDANWSIPEPGILRVDAGERGFLCTDLEWRDYELRVDFRADPSTNSGIFLRTTPRPGDLTTECLELNIAPADNPFPTGSFVHRKRLEPEQLGPFDPTQWHTFLIRVIDRHVEVDLDGRRIMDLDRIPVARSGHICLQHNEGRVEFRHLQIRPLGLDALATDDGWEADWEKTVREGAQMEVTGSDRGLHIVGGLGQLQSRQSFGDFILQASYQLARPQVNSGIFFRCIPDSMLDGYECQVNHATVDGDPLRPADGGAGAIFRRQNARIVIGDGTRPTYLTLVAQGPKMSTWVNGIQVVQFTDQRPAHENPRRGLRLDPGPISLQGHDPTTDVLYRFIRVADTP
ncbi:MAG: glycosyl hydrolase [Pirellulaceae bacterium]|nr:MAG: glycosyl hydrolase [Pirellulaceae bacterium]